MLSGASSSNPLGAARFMQRALELAQRGQGAVEPNPMVGCVVVQGDAIVGEGWHRRYGGPHAEVEALDAAGAAARGATLYVTLEPCCHHGQTPPCTEAICCAGVTRVVAAMHDPFPRVAGGGVRALEDSGVAVEIGLLAEHARALNAPYLKRLETGRPWVIAKWAMSLDGKLASRTRQSRWISNERSRELVHQLRGRVDAIVVGRGTVEADDPLLTARPRGPRVALRVVMDSTGRLDPKGQLVRTARDVPLLVVLGPHATDDAIEHLRRRGADTFRSAACGRTEQWLELLSELGRRGATNVLVEGGGQLLGTALDARSIDEVHVFVAPRLVGGTGAVVPCLGLGATTIDAGPRLSELQWELLDGDLHAWGRLPPAHKGPRGAC